MSQLIPRVRVITIEDVFVVVMDCDNHTGEVSSVAIGSALTEQAAVENAIRFSAALTNAIVRAQVAR